MGGGRVERRRGYKGGECRRSWRREGAGGRRDMVVDRRDMVQKYDKI